MHPRPGKAYDDTPIKASAICLITERQAALQYGSLSRVNSIIEVRGARQFGEAKDVVPGMGMRQHPSNELLHTSRRRRLQKLHSGTEI